MLSEVRRQGPSESGPALMTDDGTTATPDDTPAAAR